MQLHTREIMLAHFYGEISHLLHRIGVSHRFCILQHHHAVLVVFVCHRNRSARQTIKKLFLGLDIVVERFVIIQMVVGDIRKNPRRKWYPGNSSLIHRVRADFHKTMTAIGIGHLGQ